MRLWSALAGACALAIASAASAQEVPQTADQVAEPGGTLPGNPEVALVKVADGFADPVNVTNAGDGSGRLFVVERVGTVRVVDQDGNVQEEPFIDLTAINPLGTNVQTGFVEQGLYAIAFHPDYAENGYFYVHYASLPFNGDGMIVRFQAESPDAESVSAERLNETAKVVMRIPQPWYNHNGGQIVFGPDGYLYIASGDGGWEGDPLMAGQDLSTWLGKILRIDVDVPEEQDDLIPYQIPPDNPFAQAGKERLMVLFGITEEQFAEIRTQAKPEIWSWGLRNPYNIAFDQNNGDLFISDVGQNHWEEIDFQPADSEGGENYGWALREGTHCHPMIDQDSLDCPPFATLPAAQYPHQTPYPGAQELQDGWGCSVQGMGVADYLGPDQLFLAGDWCSGRLWGLAWDGSEWQFTELVQTDLQFTAGGYGEDGMVYAVNCNCFYIGEQGPTENPPGALWRIVAADQVPEGAETARTVEAPAGAEQQDGQQQDGQQQNGGDQGTQGEEAEGEEPADGEPADGQQGEQGQGGQQ